MKKYLLFAICAAVALGTVLALDTPSALAIKNFSRWNEVTAKLRNLFEKILFDRLTHISLNGPTANRLPHISNIAFHGTDSEGLLTMMPELVASTGSACHVADFAPSHVLAGLGKVPDITECSLRFGFGKGNTEQEVRAATDSICDAVNRLLTD